VKRKWLIAAGFLLVVAVLAYVSIQKAGGGSKPASAGANGPKNGPQVKVAKVAPRDLTQKVLAPGTLEPSDAQEIRAPFASLKVQLLAGPGDQVTKGQVIAVLDAADLQVQVTGQEAAVARAESALVSLRQQQQTAPLTMAMKLQNAKAQVEAAQQGLTTAMKQSETAGQRLNQAQVALLAAQGRVSSGGAEVAAAREKLLAAEAQYRANPIANAKQLQDAQAAYEAALTRSSESARQMAAELSQAQTGLQLAERDVADSGDNSPAVQQARSQLESARLALSVATEEAEAGGITAEQVRSAEADLAAQRANLANLQQKLDQAQLKAPVSGVILSVAQNLKSGQPVQQGQLLFELGSMAVMNIKARVDEVDVTKVKVGQSLSIANNAYPGEKFPGRVNRVAAQSSQVAPGSNVGAYYEVLGQVENKNGMLRGGMSAEARIVTDSRSKVIVVGLESVREEKDGAVVLVVKEFKVELRPVKLGLRTQTEVEVVEGLKEGEQIVVGPFTLIKSLKDGTLVRTEVVEQPVRGDE
jgi:HlyD family secretion protein